MPSQPESSSDFIAYKIKYGEALVKYLNDQSTGEVYLHEGYKLGREAIEKDIGILNVAAIHHDCLIDYLENIETDLHLDMSKNAGVFLEEILASFQMVDAKFREAINLLNQRSLEYASRARSLHDVLTETQFNEERLRKILEATPDAIVMIDQGGNIVFTNAQTVALFGYDQKELIGKKVEILIPELHRNRLPEHRALFFLEPRSRAMGSDMDLFGQRKNLEIFPIEISLSPLETKDGLVGLAAIRDITDRKVAVDALQESLKEKEALLKEIYHRVKNNLQVVSSLLNLQAETSEIPGVKDVLIESSARVKSMALIHEMLYQSDNLSKIDMDNYVNNLFKYLFEIYNVEANRIKLTKVIDSITLTIDTAIPCGLIINELVSNSLKYGFPGNRFGEIVFSLRSLDNNIVLMLSDDGNGIPAEIDINHTTSLGMRLVHSLTKQLGGTIELDSEKRRKFTLIFPGSK